MGFKAGACQVQRLQNAAPLALPAQVVYNADAATFAYVRLWFRWAKEGPISMESTIRTMPVVAGAGRRRLPFERLGSEPSTCSIVHEHVE